MLCMLCLEALDFDPIEQLIAYSKRIGTSYGGCYINITTQVMLFEVGCYREFPVVGGDVDLTCSHPCRTATEILFHL